MSRGWAGHVHAGGLSGREPLCAVRLQQHAMTALEPDGDVAALVHQFGRRAADYEGTAGPGDHVFDAVAVEQAPLDTALEGVDRAGVMARVAAKAGLEDCRALSYRATQEWGPDREEGPVMARALEADSMFRHGPTQMVQKRFWPSLMKS